MLSTFVWPVIIAIAVGLLVRYFLEKRGGPEQITWKEFVISATVITLIVAPLVTYVGWRMARTSLVTFHEDHNGFERSTRHEVTTCSKDGPCIHEYDCDPYKCNPHRCNCDSKGNNCSTCYDTCYHDCPYATLEWTFTVGTTIGNYTIVNHGFEDNPQSWQPQRGAGIPGNVHRGTPKFWIDAKNRVDTNTPGPVTKRAEYKNYILASDKSLFAQYSSDIESLLAAGLLPSYPAEVHDFYLADRVSFVGFSPKDGSQWISAVRYLNGSLGEDLQGSLDLVMVQDSVGRIDPDEYWMALKAYWTNKEKFGKDTLAKNNIVVIIGTADGRSVKWARVFTGMPMGNEYLEVRLADRLQRSVLDPQIVVGRADGELCDKARGRRRIPTEVRCDKHGQGIIEAALWGLEEKNTRFNRVSMSATDAHDTGSGYLFLMGQIEPTAKQKVWIAVAVFLLSVIAWVVAAFVGGHGNRFDFNLQYKPTRRFQ